MAKSTTTNVPGLHHVCDERVPGIRRLGAPGRFRYVRADGRKVTDAAELARIKSLVIPPAWTSVWICSDPQGHLQATGRDARGRKQYRYHPKFRQMRDDVKYSRLPAFAQALRAIRRRTAADVRKKGLPREKVLAAAVQLLEKTLIRIGNEEYARANGSVGLTTMRDRHAKIRGDEVRFEFRGKSGVAHAVELHDPRLAKIVKACRDLPGYELFQYVDDSGQRKTICSDDVNGYLREISGDDFTAKDFRTWAGTVLAAQALARLSRFKSQTEAKRNVMAAISCVSSRLGNTKAVCRKAYIHPAIFAAYMDGKPLPTDEAGVAAMIRKRLKKTA
ncbi:MAG: topoisomerase [Acidobacteria bacterium]|nr:topoisomerase [Acidobacteriota bacterium]